MSEDWAGGNNLLSFFSRASIAETDRKSKRILYEQGYGFGMPLRNSVNSLTSFRMARQSLQAFPVVVDKPKQIKHDKRFELWNKYLEERRQLNERLSKKLNRPIQSLIMNTIEAFRLKHEDQLMFDYITILDPPDPQRGSPAFWQIPIRLIPKSPNDIAPLEAQMNVREKCQTPQIEYVAVPNLIRQETNTLERTNNIVEKWYNKPYRKQKIEENQNRLKYIQPHKPEMDNLIVIGQKCEKFIDLPTKSTKYPRTLPIITVTNPQEYAEDTDADNDKEEKDFFNQDGIVQLKIDNILLIPNCVPKTFEIIITTSDLNKTTTKTIDFQNFGTITIYCYWRRTLCLDNKLPVSNHLPDIFIFDNSDFVIPPGQTYRISFMVNPDEYGMINEEWMLLTEPKISQITFILWANIEIEDNILTIKQALSDLPDKIETHPKRISIFKKLNIDIDENYSTPTYFITEEERFYYANLDMNRKYPKYFYQKNSIDNLKSFYSNVLHEYPKWNLNINKMITSIKEKYTLLTERNQVLNVLNNILETIKHIPTEKINTEFRKRRLVYNVLCRIVNDFVNDAVKLENHLNLHLPTVRYPNIDNLVPYQEFNVYKDEKRMLFIENSNESLVKKCIKRIDRRISVMDDKMRPPIKYKSRMNQSIEMEKPKDRYMIYKNVNNLNEIQPPNSTATSIAPTKTKVVKSILPPKSLGASTPETQSELSDNDYKSEQNIRNMKIYKKILYLKAYLHLQRACDEITSVIDSCNSSIRKPTLTLLKHLYDNLHNLN